MNKTYILFLFSVFLPFLAKAQYFYSYNNFTIGAGVPVFRGDLNSSAQTLRPSAVLAYSAPLTFKTSARLNLMYGSYGAADSLNGSKARNLSFKSPLGEATLMIMHEFMKDKHKKFFKKSHLSPYFFYGVGICYFSPTAEYNGERYDLRDLGTEGQNLPSKYGVAYAKPYKKVQLVVPLGAGLSYYVSPAFSINVEGAARMVSTDYMDDVSAASYPNQQYMQEWSPIAAALSYRGTGQVTEQIRRGNPSKRDSYFVPTLSVTYHWEQRRAF
jgi:hypothetical protein